MSREAGFRLDPRLAADTYRLADWPLCRLLLMDDDHYPWCILVPRRPDIREIYQLPASDQSQLLAESTRLGRAIMTAFAGHKLNVAALGNLVAQLHLHHVVRFDQDAAWPAPVWGRVAARRYDNNGLQAVLQRLQTVLSEVTAAQKNPEA